MGYVRAIAEHLNPNVVTTAIDLADTLVDGDGTITDPARLLLDPSLLLVAAAAVAFALLVAASVFVLRWVIVRRNPELGER